MLKILLAIVSLKRQMFWSSSAPILLSARWQQILKKTLTLISLLFILFQFSVSSPSSIIHQFSPLSSLTHRFAKTFSLSFVFNMWHSPWHIQYLHRTYISHHWMVRWAVIECTRTANNKSIVQYKCTLVQYTKNILAIV